MIVYLAGPINGCTDEEAKDWRNYAKSKLKCATLDPMARDYRGKEDENIAAIVDGDKADIDASSHLLVNYEKPSVGTAMEILYAWERGKKILIVAKTGTSISPWLRYHSKSIYSTFADAIQEINKSC